MSSRSLGRLTRASTTSFSNGEPRAPAQWPLGKNITIAVLKRELPTKRTLGVEDFIQVANSHILQGFWWAFAQALRAVARKDCKENHDAVLSFKYLMLRGVVDIVHATTLTNVTELAFQFVEDNEELRKNMGFTGFRKMLLVSWAVACVKDTKSAVLLACRRNDTWPGPCWCEEP